MLYVYIYWKCYLSKINGVNNLLYTWTFELYVHSQLVSCLLRRNVLSVVIHFQMNGFCQGAKDNKDFGFALSALFIVATVTEYFCGVSLNSECLSGGK